jgi:four helix bundle protein
MPFDALRLALALIALLKKPVAKIQIKDPDLARQIRRAASSIPLNLTEGRERVGRDRLHLYRIALGSASEVIAALGVAEGWGHVEPEDVAEPLAALDRIRAMTWRLTR